MRFQIAHAFQEKFQGDPAFLVRAPGRVNLIGEHTDYNEGFVLPIAIDRAVWIAFRPREDAIVRLFSLEFGEEISFSLRHLQRGGGWGAYVQGVAAAMQKAGMPLRGWEGVMGSELPIGAGLSSSAAVEMGVARAFAAASGIPWEPLRMARIGQRAENDWVGVSSGIMDQLAVAAAQEGHALFLDTRAMTFESIPFLKDARILIMDTGTRRALANSAYNQRREECRAAAQRLGVPSLRDATMESLLRRRDALPEPLFRRARHVITENARVRRAVAALRENDAATLGALFDESHASLREDFEVSCEALDELTALARAQKGCLGARMTGAGFGGAAIALVETEKAEETLHALETEAARNSTREAKIFPCLPSAGASLLPFDFPVNLS